MSSSAGAGRDCPIWGELQGKASAAGQDLKEKKKVSQGYNLLDMDSLILQRGFSLVKPCLHFILLAAVKWTN